MTDREKLIELIAVGRMCPVDGNPFEEEKCMSCKYLEERDCDITRLADYLIANGVTFAKDTNISSKLINTDDLKKILLEKGFYPVFVKTAMEQISEAVVRCQDCKCWSRFSVPLVGHCSLLCMTTDHDDFCSYGERVNNG